MVAEINERTKGGGAKEIKTNLHRYNLNAKNKTMGEKKNKIGPPSRRGGHLRYRFASIGI